MLSKILIWNYSSEFEAGLDTGMRYQKFFTNLIQSLKMDSLSKLTVGSLAFYLQEFRVYGLGFEKFENYLLKPTQNNVNQAIQFICLDTGIMLAEEGLRLDDKKLLKIAKSRFNTLLTQKSAFLAIEFPKIKTRKEGIEGLIRKLEDFGSAPREVYEFLKSRSSALHGCFVNENNQLVSRDIFLAILLAICESLISLPTTKRRFNFSDVIHYAINTDAQWIYRDIKDDVVWYVESWELAVISPLIAAIEEQRQLPFNMSDQQKNRFKNQLDDCIRDVLAFLSRES